LRFIYLHGFASSPLSRKAQFFADKLRGEGASVEVPALEREGFAALTISGQLKVIEEVAAGEPVRLIGSSMGGYLAALYASMHPEVDRMLLLAPAFGFAERWGLRLGAAKMEEWKSKGSLPMMHYASNSLQNVGYGLIEDGLRYPAEPEFTGEALIFHGTQDDVVPLSFSENYISGKQNVCLMTLDSGHELTDVMDLIWNESRRFLLSA
jgi:uncharacterized protein